jgi:hypothetical protein
VIFSWHVEVVGSDMGRSHFVSLAFVNAERIAGSRVIVFLARGEFNGQRKEHLAR